MMRATKTVRMVLYADIQVGQKLRFRHSTWEITKLKYVGNAHFEATLNRVCSIFEGKHDLLSRAVTAVQAIYREHTITAKLDAGFDGGEFSGPIHSQMAEEECREAVQRFGFTVATYNAQVAQRLGGRLGFFHGFLLLERTHDVNH